MYLAYFFVALSTTNDISFIFVFCVVVTFVYRSNGVYFDPIYVLKGCKIYAVTSKNDVKMYIITRKIIKNTLDLQFHELRRVNDFTFIEPAGA